MEKNELIQRSYHSFTNLSRLINSLMRSQLSQGPITVQQCYTLQSLVDGPKSMKVLATEVSLHQSTLTRIVEKLEKQGLVTRTRKSENQRSVEVRITHEGEQIYNRLYDQALKTISALLDQVPVSRHVLLVEAMETLVSLLNPMNQAFQNLLTSCCGQSPEQGGNE